MHVRENTCWKLTNFDLLITIRRVLQWYYSYTLLYGFLKKFIQPTALQIEYVDLSHLIQRTCLDIILGQIGKNV